MKDYQTISVRMPKELFEEIKENAKREHRSINQQMNLYLEKGFEKEKASA